MGPSHRYSARQRTDLFEAFQAAQSSLVTIISLLIGDLLSRHATEDIVPRLSNCSDNAKAMGQIAPATGQLTHSHR